MVVSMLRAPLLTLLQAPRHRLDATTPTSRQQLLRGLTQTGMFQRCAHEASATQEPDLRKSWLLGMAGMGKSLDDMIE
jgi:hypothetical protein